MLTLFDSFSFSSTRSIDCYLFFFHSNWSLSCSLFFIAELLLHVLPVLVADRVIVISERVAKLVDFSSEHFRIVVTVCLVDLYSLLAVHVNKKGKEIRRSIPCYVQIFDEAFNVGKLRNTEVARLKQTSEKIPRTFVVFDESDTVHSVVKFSLDGFRDEAKMLEHEKALIPC